MSSFSVLHWLIVGAVVWLGYRLFLRRAGTARPQGPPDRPSGTVDVVGESFYRQQLERLFPRNASGRDDEVSATVTLRLADHNPHDPQAVAVYIEQEQVGHLSRDDARRFRLQKGNDRRDTLVDATVWVPSDPEYNYSVTLHLHL